MNWLNQLLRNPPDDATGANVPSRPAAPPPRSAAEIQGLRTALATAEGEEERSARAQELAIALAESRSEPLAQDPQDVRVAALCQLADRGLALEWLRAVTGDEALAGIACHGRFAEVRLAAAQGVHANDALEQIARHSRNVDKAVYRHCADLLHDRRRHERDVVHAAELAQALRALLSTVPVSVSHLLELERAVKALPGDGVASECATLIAQADARVLHEGQQQRALQALAEAAQQLSRQAGTAQPEATDAIEEQLQAWRASEARLVQELAALPEWLMAGNPARAAQAGLESARGALSAFAHDLERVRDCERFLAALEPATAFAQSSHWEALAKPESVSARTRLQEQWQALRALAPEPAPPPPPEPETPVRPAARSVDLAALRPLLQRLEEAIEQGHLGAADAHARSIKAKMGGASLEGRLDARLQRALLRLTELRGWAQWGAAKKREELVAAAHELQAGGRSIEEIAVAVPALREQWKSLNPQGPAAKEMWESFDRALESAYAPVAAAHAVEAERRSRARAAKDAQLAAWEAAVASIEWEHADFRTVETQRQQILDQWRAAPQSGFRDERALRKRFDALVAKLDERIGAARAAEVARRDQLIAGALALVEAPDLRRATADAKSLQERWRAPATAPRLPRGEEQKLWKRFRAACDSVFARREAVRAEENALRAKHAEHRTALVESFEHELGADDPAALKRALDKFSAEFRNDAPPARHGPRPHGEPADALDRRARELQQRALQRLDGLRQDAYRKRLEELAGQAPAADGMDDEARAAAASARGDLLIDLEMALGLPSPETAADARRRRQIAQLQERFRGGAAAVQDPEKLLRQYHAIAAVPDAQGDERLQAILRAMTARATGPARRPKGRN